MLALGHEVWASVQASGKGTMQRRAFLRGSVALAFSAGMGPFLLGSTAAPTERDRAYFASLVDRWFHVRVDSWQSVQLVELNDGAAAWEVEQFTLVFRGSPHMAFEEGTYEVAAEEGDSFDLFLQPATREGSGQYFSASFSLIRPQPAGCAAAA